MMGNDKQAVTAYLPKDLVEKMDEYLIKAPQYRSRGHFIEVLIRDAIERK